MRTLMLLNVKEKNIVFNSIEFKSNWVELKLHEVTLNIFIQMELNFHKNQSIVKTKCW
jgi:hypothetical protein